MGRKGSVSKRKKKSRFSSPRKQSMERGPDGEGVLTTTAAKRDAGTNQKGAERIEDTQKLKSVEADGKGTFAKSRPWDPDIPNLIKGALAWSQKKNCPAGLGL